MQPAPTVLPGLFLIVLATGLTSPAGAQTVLIGGSVRNGNLDRTHAVEIVPGFFLPKPNVWVSEGTLAIAGATEQDLSSEPWAGPSPTPETTDGDLNPPSPEGCGGPDCAVFFKPFSGNVVNGALTAHLYQELPAVPGSTYLFTGWAGGEANILAAGAEIAVHFLNAAHNLILGNGQVVQLLPTLNVPNGQPLNYKPYAAIALAPAGTHFVRVRISLFEGLANPGGGSQAFVVDDFVLTGTKELFFDGFETGNVNRWSDAVP